MLVAQLSVKDTSYLQLLLLRFNVTSSLLNTAASFRPEAVCFLRLFVIEQIKLCFNEVAFNLMLNLHRFKLYQQESVQMCSVATLATSTFTVLMYRLISFGTLMCFTSQPLPFASVVQITK